MMCRHRPTTSFCLLDGLEGGLSDICRPIYDFLVIVELEPSFRLLLSTME